jgi:hypothetical protein
VHKYLGLDQGQVLTQVANIVQEAFRCGHEGVSPTLLSAPMERRRRPPILDYLPPQVSSSLSLA